MLDTKENIRNFHFDAIIILAIVFFGLLFYKNSFSNTNELERKLVSTYIAVSDNNSITGSCIRLQVFKKTWISNKDNFNLLAFNMNPLSENRKTNLKVNHLLIIRQKSYKILQFILRYHLFPAEMDEPPHLS
jgi:aspartate-semialdehyde dehydrogenase